MMMTHISPTIVVKSIIVRMLIKIDNIAMPDDDSSDYDKDNTNCIDNNLTHKKETETQQHCQWNNDLHRSYVTGEVRGAFCECKPLVLSCRRHYIVVCIIVLYW